MIWRLMKIIAVLDHVHFIMDRMGDYNWAYRIDKFSDARNELSQLGDYKSARVMDRLIIREKMARARWRPGQREKFG